MIVKLDIHDEKDKKKAMKSLSSFAEIDNNWSNIDPVDIVIKLRKHSHAELLLVGPAEEPKKEEPKKEEAKKEEPKKEEAKKEEPKKEEPKRAYYYDPYDGYHWHQKDP
ncbi:hypothetical protein MKW94_018547 [Papaver nudicaule]|uniref:Uncharacterized protein n=1 Tax=Papaver nudicaule TaxID=74823 RepID=A0AA41V6A1_PAPNU|nr:hypothetical protein [Papaver nudicaule]